ncbi:hypothetical protein [Pyxidicoccus xibeiensis]|uniref:hypothetical protein n=1 Tax=Pyxidicoccus xibeiensis TaxID=2906759 RepID=UPI0020A72A9E|nr:hypothetical protein [Pyxidicoccus xibeiensis]MCP3139570.1 hypothetical protein [Pyxidicoccus xibeiensis]
MSFSRFGRPGPWRLRGRPQHYEVVLGSDAAAADTGLQVPSAFICWHLDHWLTYARSTLLEMYEALGGHAPRGLSSLERSRNDQRIRERLVRAFEQGELVAVRVDEPAGAWFWPEPPEPIRPEPPAPRPVAVIEEELFPDAARQAETLRRAAEQGVPFCEECERRRKQRAAA